MDSTDPLWPIPQWARPLLVAAWDHAEDMRMAKWAQTDEGQAVLARARAAEAADQA